MAARPGVLHGNKTYLLQDTGRPDSPRRTRSAAGLDYPGIGPEHSWLLRGSAGWITCTATDERSVGSVPALFQTRGYHPGTGDARTRLAYIAKLAPGMMRRDETIVLNLSAAVVTRTSSRLPPIRGPRFEPHRRPLREPEKRKGAALSFPSWKPSTLIWKPARPS